VIRIPRTRLFAAAGATLSGALFAFLCFSSAPLALAAEVSEQPARWPVLCLGSFPILSTVALALAASYFLLKSREPRPTLPLLLVTMEVLYLVLADFPRLFVQFHWSHLTGDLLLFAVDLVLVNHLFRNGELQPN
jgi:hypothetical protein